jgi:flagellar assembly factor FliW
MNIESPRYGNLEVDPSKIIEFPRGLPGFEECHRFALLEPSENPKFFILQSLDMAEVAFHIADPSTLGFSYEISLSDEDEAMLGPGNPGDFAVVVILSKPDEAAALSANLNAPLVINLATRRGFQHVFASLKYAVTLKAGE